MLTSGAAKSSGLYRDCHYNGWKNYSFIFWFIYLNVIVKIIVFDWRIDCFLARTRNLDILRQYFRNFLKYKLIHINTSVKLCLFIWYKCFIYKSLGVVGLRQQLLGRISIQQNPGRPWIADTRLCRESVRCNRENVRREMITSI